MGCTETFFREPSRIRSRSIGGSRYIVELDYDVGVLDNKAGVTVLYELTQAQYYEWQRTRHRPPGANWCPVSSRYSTLDVEVDYIHPHLLHSRKEWREIVSAGRAKQLAMLTASVDRFFEMIDLGTNESAEAASSASCDESTCDSEFKFSTLRWEYFAPLNSRYSKTREWSEKEGRAPVAATHSPCNTTRGVTIEQTAQAINILSRGRAEPITYTLDIPWLGLRVTTTDPDRFVREAVVTNLGPNEWRVKGVQTITYLTQP